MAAIWPRKLANLGIGVAFVIALWVPLGIRWARGSTANVAIENRAAAVFPDLQLQRESIERFPTKFENYYQDTFEFRKPLLWVNNLIKVCVLGVSPSPNVILGKDGWLFYSQFPVGEDREAIRPLTAAELENWRQLLQARSDDLAKQGVKYLLVIAPDKQTIYPDYLPGRVRSRLPAASRLDQLFEHLRAHSTVAFVDLRPVLREGRKREDLYYHTDSHWNGAGAYLAYGEIVTALKRWFSQMEPRPRDQVERIEGVGAGDLAHMIGLPDRMRETIPISYVPKTPKARFSLGAEGFAEKPYLLGHEKLYTTDVPESTGPRAVFLRDSFAGALMPMIAEHFQRAVFIPTYVMDREAIGRERPNVVVQEMVERMLCMPAQSFADPVPGATP